MSHYQIKFNQKLFNCYISLPKKLADKIQNKYTENTICQPIKVTSQNNQKVYYFGYFGNVSESEEEVEIFGDFAKYNDIQEGDFVDVSLANNLETKNQIEIWTKTISDYQIANLNREKIESSLLNGISVLFYNAVFPIYYQKNSYLTFEYKEKQPIIISTQASLIINCKDEKHQKSKQKTENKGDQNQQQYQQIQHQFQMQKLTNICQISYQNKLTNLSKEQIENLEQSNINNGEIQVPSKLFDSLNLQEGKIYKLILDKKQEFSKIKDFSQFIQIQESQKIKQKKKMGENNLQQQNNNFNQSEDNEALVYFKKMNFSNFDGLGFQVFFNPFMKFVNKQIYRSGKNFQIDTDFELEDQNYNRILTLTDFMDQNINKIKLIFFQLRENSNTIIKGIGNKINNQVIELVKHYPYSILYSDQIFNFNGNYYILKILNSQQLQQEQKQENQKNLNSQQKQQQQNNNPAQYLKMLVIDNRHEKQNIKCKNYNYEHLLKLNRQISKDNLQEYEKNQQSQQSQKKIQDKDLMYTNEINKSQDNRKILQNVAFKTVQEFNFVYGSAKIIKINQFVSKQIAQLKKFNSLKSQCKIYEIFHKNNLDKINEFLHQQQQNIFKKEIPQQIQKNLIILSGKEKIGKTFLFQYLKYYNLFSELFDIQHKRQKEDIKNQQINKTETPKSAIYQQKQIDLNAINQEELKIQQQFEEEQNLKEIQNQVKNLAQIQRIFINNRLQTCIQYIDLQAIQNRNAHLDQAKRFIEQKIINLSTQKNNLKVLFIDNIEILCKHPERIDFQQTQDILISNVMAKYLRDKIKQYPQIHFIITAQSQDHINEKLIKNLYENIKLIAPNYVLRKKFFENQQLFQQQDKFDFSDQTIDKFANLTDNFTIGDFFTLFEQIQQILEINQNNIINKQEIEEEIQKLQNFSFKSASKFPQFEHVGGLNQTKESLKETFQLPIRYEFLFKKIDIKIPRGVFLYGPTGCGKTYMAQATANELGLNYLSIKGPELLNKYIGQSEQSVRDVFEKAQSMKPCIIFFDEFDAIVPRRNSGSTGVTDRVVNQFLTYLDGVASLDGVYILAASSRPELIDPALLRPGRLDKHLYVNFPDQEERLNILKIYGKELDLEGFTLEDIAQQTEFSTSADLVALLKELRLKLANELFENKTEIELQNINISDLKITKEFYEKVLKDFRRSLSKQEVQYQHQNYEQFQSKQPDVNKQKTTLY